MPVTQDWIANLDADLDTLVNPTTSDVLEISQDYEPGIVAASAVRRAAQIIAAIVTTIA